MNELRTRIQDLPKGDVHSHLHLSGNIKALKKQYPNADISLPHHYEGLPGMIDFIHNKVNKIMCTAPDLIHFMEMGIQSAIDDHVVYYEASIDISLTKFFDGSIDKLNAVVSDLITKYKSQINFMPDLGINKDIDMSKATSDGFKCIKSGLYNGIDIYGKESDKNLKGFVDIFNKARENNMKTKVHIGEFSNSQTINEAINLLNPDEIQHGIMAANSNKTMDLILKNDIQLNICPQSNVSLGSVRHILQHPIRKLYDHGIKLTINTDDFLLFNASITDQFIMLLEHDIFTFEELDSIRKNALQY